MQGSTYGEEALHGGESRLKVVLALLHASITEGSGEEGDVSLLLRAGGEKVSSNGGGHGGDNATNLDGNLLNASVGLGTVAGSDKVGLLELLETL